VRRADHEAGLVRVKAGAWLSTATEPAVVWLRSDNRLAGEELGCQTRACEVGENVQGRRYRK